MRFNRKIAFLHFSSEEYLADIPIVLDFISEHDLMRIKRYESQDAPVPDEVLRALWHALSSDRVGRRNHSDISVTMNVYTHPGLQDAATEMARMKVVEEVRQEQEKLSGTGEKKDMVNRNMFRVI